MINVRAYASEDLRAFLITPKRATRRRGGWRVGEKFSTHIYDVVLPAHDVPRHEGETLKITGRECKGRSRGTQRSITGGTYGEYPGIESCIIPRVVMRRDINSARRNLSDRLRPGVFHSADRMG